VSGGLAAVLALRGFVALVAAETRDEPDGGVGMLIRPKSVLASSATSTAAAR
jgi:hypothetical protein